MSKVASSLLSRASQLIRGVGRTWEGERVTRVIFAYLLLIAASVTAGPKAPWYEERVAWQHGSEPVAWRRSIASPKGVQYQVALVPLWAVEGGIVAFEVAITGADESEHNLLGERDSAVPQAFVITVEDLAAGLPGSRFGATRSFKLKRPSKVLLRVQVVDHKLGSGQGNCRSCANIQALTAVVSLEGR